MKYLIIKILKRIKYKVKFYPHSKTSMDSVFEGNNVLLNHVSFFHSYLGFGSYVAGNTKLSRIKIGKYCSIGQNVQNSLGIHPTIEFISTHPAFYSNKKQAGFTFVNKSIFPERKYADEQNTYVNIIGNDVWIGNNVILMEGIRIGHGSIIGAGAIITRDIEPYSIAVGVPAKVIRKRFKNEEIKFLLKLRWWDKDINWIKQNINNFTSPSLLMKINK